MMPGPDIELIAGEFQSAGLSGRRFAHIITDPPYEKEFHAVKAHARKLRTDGGQELKEIAFDHITESARAALCTLAKQACEGWLIVFCNTEGVAAWRDAMQAAGLKYKGARVWVKRDAAPKFNGDGPALAHEVICFAWCAGGHSKWNCRGRRGIFDHLVNGGARDGRHPTEKPLTLMLDLVLSFSAEGDLILDPFCGSGTTGLAAKMARRRFVGVERSPDFLAIARDRLEMALPPEADDLGPLFSQSDERAA